MIKTRTRAPRSGSGGRQVAGWLATLATTTATAAAVTAVAEIDIQGDVQVHATHAQTLQVHEVVQLLAVVRRAGGAQCRAAGAASCTRRSVHSTKSRPSPRVIAASTSLGRCCHTGAVRLTPLL